MNKSYLLIVGYILILLISLITLRKNIEKMTNTRYIKKYKIQHPNNKYWTIQNGRLAYGDTATEWEIIGDILENGNIVNAVIKSEDTYIIKADGGGGYVYLSPTGTVDNAYRMKVSITDTGSGLTGNITQEGDGNFKLVNHEQMYWNAEATPAEFIFTEVPVEIPTTSYRPNKYTGVYKIKSGENYWTIRSNGRLGLMSVQNPTEWEIIGDILENGNIKNAVIKSGDIYLIKADGGDGYVYLSPTGTADNAYKVDISISDSGSGKSYITERGFKLVNHEQMYWNAEATPAEFEFIPIAEHTPIAPLYKPDKYTAVYKIKNSVNYWTIKSDGSLGLLPVKTPTEWEIVGDILTDGSIINAIIKSGDKYLIKADGGDGYVFLSPTGTTENAYRVNVSITDTGSGLTGNITQEGDENFKLVNHEQMYWNAEAAPAEFEFIPVAEHTPKNSSYTNDHKTTVYKIKSGDNYWTIRSAGNLGLLSVKTPTEWEITGDISSDGSISNAFIKSGDKYIIKVNGGDGYVFLSPTGTSESEAYKVKVSINDNDSGNITQEGDGNFKLVNHEQMYWNAEATSAEFEFILVAPPVPEPEPDPVPEPPSWYLSRNTTPPSNTIPPVTTTPSSTTCPVGQKGTPPNCYTPKTGCFSLF